MDQLRTILVSEHEHEQLEQQNRKCQRCNDGSAVSSDILDRQLLNLWKTDISKLAKQTEVTSFATTFQATSSPDFSKVHRSWKSELPASFFAMVSVNSLQLILDSINSTMNIKTSTKQVNHNTSRYYTAVLWKHFLEVNFNIDVLFCVILTI